MYESLRALHEAIWGRDVEVYDRTTQQIEVLHFPDVSEKQPTAVEYYDDCLRSFVNLNTRWRDLVLVEKTLSAIPSAGIPGVSDADLLEFLYRSWISLIVSLHDLAQQLCNSVLDLGVRRDRLAKHHITENKHVTGAVMECLKEIERLMQEKAEGNKPYWNIRNDHLHAGDATFNSFEALRRLVMRPPDNWSDTDIQIEVGKVAKEKLLEVAAQNTMLRDRLDDLSEALSEVVLQKATQVSGRVNT